MQPTIWEMIAETPWWFFFLAIFLIYQSIKATAPRIIAVRALLLFVPPLFLILFISLFIVVPPTPPHLFTILCGTLPGAFIGWLQLSFSNIKAIKNENKCFVPGSWLGFIIVPMLLIAQYHFLDFARGLNTSLLHQPEALPYVLGVTGLILGLFIGKMAFLMRCVRRGPYLTTT